MRLEITRSPSDERTFSVETGGRTRPGVRDFELKQWLLNVGVGDSTIAAVLDMEPDVTMVVQVREAA